MKIKDAPGLEARRLADGRIQYRWVASKKARAAGFEPRVVTLTIEDPDEIAHRCRLFTAEANEFLAGPAPLQLAPTGTIAWIVDRYQVDADSPYRDLRQSTRRSYDESLAIVRKSVGKRVIAAVTGPDIRRWYKLWGRADEQTGELANPRRAYGCIQMLRLVAGYGKSLKDGPCRELKWMLEEMAFTQPKRRTERMTFDQAKAFRAAAHQAGRPEMALAMALQFELSLRQKDVIGEWIAGAASGGITDGPERVTRNPRHQPRRQVQWAWGLTWSQIDAHLILKKPTSKSNGNVTAEHDLRRYPEVLAELAHVPADRRVGPVIVDPSSGLPFRRRHFADLFRQIATAAGIPPGVWNMDSRAGAISEAYEAGAEPTDVMKAAGHLQVQTSMRYNRGALEQTGRVADLRAERRKRQKP